jgi:hypothetical protein
MSESAWSTFLSSISSAAVYKRAVEGYVSYCDLNELDSGDAKNIIIYITYLREEQDMAGKTLWSINSMICSYFVLD